VSITFSGTEDVWNAGNNHGLGKSAKPWTATYTYSGTFNCGRNNFTPPLDPTRPAEGHPEQPDHDNAGTHWTYRSMSVQVPGCHFVALNEGSVNGDVHGLVSFDMAPDVDFKLFERTQGAVEWTERTGFAALDCSGGRDCPDECRLATPLPPSPEHANDASQPHWKIERGDCVLFAPPDMPSHEARVFARLPAPIGH
jgi:hypothetical protein